MSPYLALARDLTLGHPADTLVRGDRAECPRMRFLAAVIRLEGAGCPEAATARRIYARSDLVDDFATPEAEVVARIVRVLIGIEPTDARVQALVREAIEAVCEIAAGKLGDA